MTTLFSVLCISGVLLVLPGCDRDSTGTREAAGTTPRSDVDNTRENRPDIANNEKTPIDQSESKADVTITAEIRRAILKADGMSINAQNCKVITEQGRVTLRGPVDTQTEKDTIGSLAAAVQGVVHVDNFLEVKAGD